MIKFISLTFVLILTLILEVSADTGCAMNVNNSSSEIIFTVESGTVSGYRNFNSPSTSNNIGFPSACPRYDYNLASPINTRCAINGVYNSSYRIITFTPLNCPIDDYIPLMILAASGVGVFLLRRKNVLIY